MTRTSAPTSGRPHPLDQRGGPAQQQGQPDGDRRGGDDDGQVRLDSGVPRGQGDHHADGAGAGHDGQRHRAHRDVHLPAGRRPSAGAGAVKPSRWLSIPNPA